MVGIYICLTAGVLSAIARQPPAPFIEDPLFDSAHDGEFVWHEGEQAWWVTYLQNR